MLKSFQLYKSRRNKIIIDEEFHSLLSKFSFQNNYNLIFNSSKLINLEIGSGSGEFIISRAKKDPNSIYLISEVYNPGIKKILYHVDKTQITNIYVINNDVRTLLPYFPDKFFNNIFIFFPDPWPKKRHCKRRLINSSFLDLISKKFKSRVFIATDHIDYAKCILSDILRCEFIKVNKIKIFNKPFLKTKYESIALKMHRKTHVIAFTSTFA